MLELYPDRVNPGGALWLSARAVKPFFERIKKCVPRHNSNSASNPGEHFEHEH